MPVKQQKEKKKVYLCMWVEGWVFVFTVVATDLENFLKFS